MRIGLEIKILNNLIEKEIRSAAAVEDMDRLTNMHGRILGYIDRNADRPIFQRDIEHEFMISGPSVSEILKLMERNGLVERKSVDYDARLKRIVLTDLARTMQQKVKKSIDSVEEELASCLTEEELRVLETAVKKISEMLKQKNKKETLC